MRSATAVRTLSACVAVVALVFLTGGCDWALLGFSSSHTGNNPEMTVNTSNVSTLTEKFTTSPTTQIIYSQPVVANGVMYAISESELNAYSANGSAGCSSVPTVCVPLWSASLGTGPDESTPAVANGVVYVLTVSTVSGTPDQLEAFDAAGKTNCSGTPTVCSPLWTATVNAGQSESPTVVGGFVYVVDGSNGGKVEAFDANGLIDCSGTPKTCSPIWTSTALGPSFEGIVGYPVTVSNNVAYAVGNATIYAFDASGNTDCSGTPKVCSPMWQYTPTVAQVSGYPVVAGGTLYIDSFSFTGTAMNPSFAGALEAFDASGVTNCSGTPTVCSPLWQTAGNTYASQAPPAIADNTVFVGAFSGPVAAFDANGSINCSGAPKTCTPRWVTSTTAAPWGGSGDEGLVVGGNVLYAMANNDSVYAFDAMGTADCSSSVCNPLWSSTPLGGSGFSVTIANGILYFGTFTTSGGMLHAYGLP